MSGQGIPDDLKRPDELPVAAEGALAAAIARLAMPEEELSRTRQAFAAALEVLAQGRARSRVPTA